MLEQVGLRRIGAVTRVNVLEGALVLDLLERIVESWEGVSRKSQELGGSADACSRGIATI